MQSLSCRHGLPASGLPDASGDIHVNLDSSTPCWNDGIERPLLEVTEVRLAFSKELRTRNGRQNNDGATFVC
jgi:hypothetical protein